MASSKGLVWIVLVLALVAELPAETRCPKGVASVPLHFVNGYQIIVAVSVDRSGPYEFLLDTGTQFTMIDPSLTAELHLDAIGSLPLSGNGFRTTSSVVKVDRLEVGPYAAANVKALEFDVRNIRPRYTNLRGVLGEDFLQQFDMLIDNAHRLLCLDDSTVLRSALKGAGIPLLTASATERVPANSLILAVRFLYSK